MITVKENRCLLMKFKYITILAIAILVSILILELENVTGENELKTDLKIITSLSDGGFMTPALSKNSTYVYCNFEFHLYSNTENTSYRILIDNNTIQISTIIEFKDIFYYNFSKKYIDILEVHIGSHYYSYSNIFVYYSSVVNKSVIREDENIVTFTKEEFENYIRELEIKMFTSNIFAWVLAGFISFYYVKKYKENKIEVVA